MVFITHNDYRLAYQFFKEKGALSESTAVSMSKDDWMTVGYKFKTGMELSRNTKNKGFIRVTEEDKVWFDLDGYVAFAESRPREFKKIINVAFIFAMILLATLLLFGYFIGNIG